MNNGYLYGTLSGNILFRVILKHTPLPRIKKNVCHREDPEKRHA